LSSRTSVLNPNWRERNSETRSLGALG